MRPPELYFDWTKVMHRDVDACNRTWRCVNTAGESALKVYSERRIPCRTRESDLHQQHAGLMLYQLNYVPRSLEWMHKTLSGVIAYLYVSAFLKLGT